MTKPTTLAREARLCCTAATPNDSYGRWAYLSWVWEQGAATTEIARSVQQTARSAQDVTVNIGRVSQAAIETGAAAEQVLSAATNLSRQAERLMSEVGSFIAEVRAT